ncbi:MAG TPA: permease, partial [bacterium]|nr:permease [bacterium]
MAEHACCQHENEPPKPWYARSFFWILAGTAFLLILSFAFPPFKKFHHAFFDYFKMVAWPAAAGFLIGGIVDYYIPREYISKYLAAKSKRTVFYAAGLGFLMSACSHGILALSMELHKKGASGPAVISFLLASPWANLPVTFLLIGFF